MLSAQLNSGTSWRLRSLCRVLLWARKRSWEVPGEWKAYSQANKPDPSNQADKMSHLKNRAEKQKRQWERMESIEARLAAGYKKELPRQTKTLALKSEVLYDIPTVAGEKKDTSGPLPNSYSPRYTEAAWYAWWVKEGFFKPEYQHQLPHQKSEVFSLSIPPPNVTGSLHLGHALTVAIEDAVVRWKRMEGYKVLWVPGSDHAGIATQAVVERKIWKEQRALRQDLTRQEFLQEVWNWKEEKGNEILQQLKVMGVSLDWDRACFTMDSAFSRAVAEAFVRLHEEGLIYRDRQLVNWSCALQSAISDIEVENRQLEGRTELSVPGVPGKVPFGLLVTFAYKVYGKEDLRTGEELPVATTRPETMLGDVAVAVHPDDLRYTHLHGKKLHHPFTGQLLPIITDPSVERDMGTGAVKITPAHSHIDYELARRHGLPVVSVIAEDGTMTARCGEWLQGQNRFLAREKVLAALKERGLYRGVKEHPLVLPICSRSGDVIENLLKSQWFVRCEAMARKALDAMESRQLKLVPEFHEKNWNTWLLKISDWCISRQLWWGHQIPAYRVTILNSLDTMKEESDGLWVVGRTEAEARKKAAGMLGKSEEDLKLVRDEDVLDTWFSSALFPFASLGWPHQTGDLQQFYPNSLLETGSDLLFFWVARMVMLGEQLTGKLPFSQVFLHPMVRDSHGRKMSKSLGNVIDPLDIIYGASLQALQEKLQNSDLDPKEVAIAMEDQHQAFPEGIPECGTDALRFALCSYSTQGDSINLDVAAVENASHFCNKVWNALKFTLAALGEGFTPLAPEKFFPSSPMDRWILSRLYHTAQDCAQSFEKFELHVVTTATHLFWLHDFCSVYLESIKPILYIGDPARLLSTRQTLYSCADLALRLLSPFMPYLTEELWQRLPKADSASPPSICVARYPNTEHLAHWSHPEEEANFLLVQEVIKAVRNLRSKYQLTKARPTVYVVCPELAARDVYENYQEPLQTLCFAGSLRFLVDPETAEVPVGCVATKANDHTNIYMDLQGLVDPPKELLKLRSRQQKLEQQLTGLTIRVQGDRYQEQVSLKAKSHLQQKISYLHSELEQIKQAIETFQKMAAR